MPASVDQNKIKQLESQIREVHKQLRNLGDENSSGATELFRIIHNPGYTTVLDVALATAQLESVQAQLRALTSMMQSLQQGAKNALPETRSAGGN
jgi:hypothetical protein